MNETEAKLNPPKVIIIAGPNGAGKSTIAQTLLPNAFGIPHFVNADTIARGLSAFRSEEWAVKASRLMLEHIHELAKERQNFAFETTLSSKTLAPWLRELKDQGYRVLVYFVWIPSAEFAVQRVRQRKASGGHLVPESDVRRRFDRSIQNLVNLYIPLADRWRVIDNSEPGTPRIVAESVENAVRIIAPDVRNEIC